MGAIPGIRLTLSIGSLFALCIGDFERRGEVFDWELFLIALGVVWTVGLLLMSLGFVKALLLRISDQVGS